MARGARDDSRRDSLPALLGFCVEKKIIDEETAREIDEYRRTSGVGIARSLHDFGIEALSMDQALQLEEALAARGTYAPLLLGAGRNPQLTFENMVRCRRNEFPIEVAESVAAAADASPYSPLYVYSDVGLGKTYLLTAIANRAEAARPLLVNTVDLELEHDRACRLGCRAELLKWLDGFGLLLIDDVQFAEGDAMLQQELFSVINKMTEDGRSVVISSDVPPTRLKRMEQRLVSRFGGGVIVSLAMPERQERAEIVRRMPRAGGLPEEVVVYLAEHVDDSVRHLKAAARQLAAMGAHSGMDVNLDLARAVVPLPEDLHRTSSVPPGPRQAADEGAGEPADDSATFKRMLQSAETEEEQILALQIAVGARLRELREAGEDPAAQSRLEIALRLLREGKKEEAIACIG